MSNAYGAVTWWGFSPALDLLETLSRHEVEYEEQSEVNFLLVGASDGRHVLKSLSKLKTKQKKQKQQKVNFYIIENNLEALARQMLFLTLALEPDSNTSLQEKSELLLELFGNSLIRSQTDDYLRERCNDFIAWITSSSDTRDPIWNFSNLKFKERDGLESIFKFWRNEDTAVFNIGSCWDERLRQYLGVRYDFREGAYDWDHSMNLALKAKIVNWKEYKYWREYGVAFRKREDCSYEVPNKTLASGLIFKKDGERIPQRGYWGDIINSPYIAYGIESHNELLFKKQNDAHTKTSTDVAFFNIASMIHELHTGLEYKQVDTENNNNGVIIEEVEEEEEEEVEENFEVPNITVHLLPLDCIADLHKKSKYKSKFDEMFFSNSMVHNLTDSVKSLFRKDGLLLVESTKFMLELKDENHVEYNKKITAMAATAGCEEIKKFDPEKHSFAAFKYKGL